jgi:uncharacterized protein YutE (UPF0331/DUF86 family)
MVSIHEKFKILTKELDLTIPQFAKELGYERADNFYSITSGRSKPGWEIIEAIARTFPQVNLDWLLRDEGNVFKSPSENPVELQNPVLDLHEQMIQLEKSITQLEEKITFNVKHLKKFGQDDTIKLLTEQLPHYNAAFLVIIASQIELVLQAIASKAQLATTEIPLSPVKLIRLLTEANALHPDVIEAFSKFWQLKNQIVHSILVPLNEVILLSLIENGIRIVRLLKVNYNR